MLETELGLIMSVWKMLLSKLKLVMGPEPGRMTANGGLGCMKSAIWYLVSF